MTKDPNSHLLLFRTPKDVMESGVTTIVRGEGCRIYDQYGKSYLDMVAGITRPVHIGYGREDLAQALIRFSQFLIVSPCWATYSLPGEAPHFRQTGSYVELVVPHSGQA